MAGNDSGIPSVADVIVVGSGSGGAVVARRLVDAGADVIIVEAGAPDDNPAIHDPPRLFELWDSEQDWGYRTAPQAACAGRELHWPRGKVLGGSSALNGMIYTRGHRSDYDAWAYLGNDGWGYDDVLPLFKRSEDFDRGASAYHGAGGPLHVLSRYEPHPLNAAVVAAAQEAGIAFNDDHNGESLDGVSFCQLNDQGRHPPEHRDGISRAGLWCSQPDRADASLRAAAALRRRALRRRRDPPRRRCLADPRRARGCGLRRHGRVAQAPVALGHRPGRGARRPRNRRRRRSAGCRANLHDHVLSPVIYGASRPVPPPLPGLQQLHSHLFWRSRPGLPGPDVQPLFFHLPLYLDGMEGPPDGYTLMAGIIRPASRGSLRLATADPAAPPLIDPACLSCEVDADALVAAIELCREIGGQAALAEWRGRELYPGPGAQTRQELLDYVRRTAITYHHQVGTCRMGVDADAVVDPQLRVRGIEGLRVADASIMPFVSSGNTHAPTVMIGERAADFVLGSTPAQKPWPISARAAG